MILELFAFLPQALENRRNFFFIFCRVTRIANIELDFPGEIGDRLLETRQFRSIRPLGGGGTCLACRHDPFNEFVVLANQRRQLLAKKSQDNPAVRF